MLVGDKGGKRRPLFPKGEEKKTAAKIEDKRGSKHSNAASSSQLLSKKRDPSVRGRLD